MMHVINVLPWAIAMAAVAAALWFLGAYLRAVYTLEQAKLDLQRAKQAEIDTAERLRTALKEYQDAEQHLSNDEVLRLVQRRSRQLVVLVAWTDSTRHDSYTSCFLGHPALLLEMLSNAPHHLAEVMRRKQADQRPTQEGQVSQDDSAPPGDEP